MDALGEAAVAEVVDALGEAAVVPLPAVTEVEDASGEAAIEPVWFEVEVSWAGLEVARTVQILVPQLVTVIKVVSSSLTVAVSWETLDLLADVIWEPEETIVPETPDVPAVLVAKAEPVEVAEEPWVFEVDGLVAAAVPLDVNIEAPEPPVEVELEAPDSSEVAELKPETVEVAELVEVAVLSVVMPNSAAAS